MSVVIMRAINTDAEELLLVQKLAYQTEAELYSDYTIEPLLQTIEDLENQFQTYIILKAVVNGKIVGSVRAYKLNELCFIERLFVHTEYRSKGYSKLLMREIEKEIVSKRYRLYTGIKSERNIKLYESLGFRIYKSKMVNSNLGFVYMEKSNS